MASWRRICATAVFLSAAYLIHAEDETKRREIPSVRFSEAPVIDGDISDPVWQEASAGSKFTDLRTRKPAENQTRFWIGYDDAAIYLAAHCEDNDPQGVIVQQTKRDSDLSNDDHISFEIDPYHTHEWNEFSVFSVSARGTQASSMGGGRGGKTEWKGDWKAAAKMVENGWTVEIAVPWSILAYPDSQEPTDIGFNVRRKHPRERIETIFSNIGETYQNEWAANWTGLTLPAQSFSPELLALPFLAAGGVESAGEYQGSARGGVDLRYRPTQQLTAVMTINPDFQNIEGDVEGIDFTRGERYVDDRRPFFREGSDTFQSWTGAGSYFYSRRIEHIDAGAKLYGKVAKRTNIGAMGTFDFDDQHGNARRLYRHDILAGLKQGFQDWGSASVLFSMRDSAQEQNSVVGYSADAQLSDSFSVGAEYGASAWRNGEGGAFQKDELAGVDINYWAPGRYIGASAGFLGPEFESSNGFFDFQGRRYTSLYLGLWHEDPKALIRDYAIDLWASYAERYETGSGFSGFGNLLERAVSQMGERGQGDFFQDNVGFWTGARFQNETFIHQEFSTGHFRESNTSKLDVDWSHGSRIGIDNLERTRGAQAYHGWGSSDGLRRHFTHISGFIRHDPISFNADMSLLRHRERLQQYLFGFNYDFSDTIGIGGRVIFRRNDQTGESSWVPYAAFRRSGAAGIETFLILGDPNGDSFVPRLEGKILLPL
ncbi:MAG: DUF5916 domain-containing protein [Candidatus Poribacteria bacterium]|nr:DUF5916 domain-containing protein [Candidatus Poribacteria bacterium]